MSENKNHDLDADIIRGIGALLVVIGHSGEQWLAGCIEFIYGFHMPLFFLLSGYLFNYEKWNKQGIKALARKKAYAYIVPYFVLSFINLFLNCIEESKIINGNDLLKSTLIHIFWIFYSGGTADTTPNCTPLWFLPCIFLCNLYLLLLLRISNKMYRIYACLLMVGLEVVLVMLEVPQLPWHMGRALVGTVFAVVGYELKSEDILSKMKWYSFLALLGIGYISIMLNSRIDINSGWFGNELLFFTGAISISVAIFSLVKFVKYKLRVLIFIGNCTYMIMGFNFYIRDLAYKLSGRLPLANIILVGTVFRIACTLAGCCLLYLCWEQMKKIYKHYTVHFSDN